MSKLKRALQEFRRNGQIESPAKKVSKTEPKVCKLITLPIENLGEIIGYLEITDVISLISTCKYIKYIMHPDGTEGRRIWNILRKKLGWPDPNSIGLTDFEFLKCQYGRGCNFCPLSPRIRTPKWEFGGLRMCKICTKERTIRDYNLSHVEKERCEFVPFIHKSGRFWYENWSYKVYLIDSIPDHPLTSAETEKMASHFSALQSFIEEVKSNVCRLDLERRMINAELSKKRVADVMQYMESHFPEIHPKIYREFSAVQRACEKTIPLGCRSRKLLQNNIQRELYLNFNDLYHYQLFAHLSDLLEGNAMRQKDYEELNARCVGRVSTTLPSRNDVQINCSDVIKRARQRKWTKQYINELKHMECYVHNELEKSIPFTSGQPEDKDRFVELVEETKNKMLIRSEWLLMINFDVHGPWVSKYTTLETLALKESPLFLTVLPENKDVFAGMADGANQRMKTRDKWWQKYVVGDAETSGWEGRIMELHPFRTAHEDQESEFVNQVQVAKDWAFNLPADIIELSQKERILWCERCKYCIVSGATFDVIARHRVACKGETNSLV